MSSRRRVWIATSVASLTLLGVAAACSGDDGASDEDVGLPDRVGEAGADGGGTSTCTPRCLDDQTLEGCASGAPAPVPCPSGCNAAEARCYTLEPAGVASPDDATQATSPLDLSSAGVYIVNTDDGSITGPSGVVRGSGPGVVAGITYRQADQPDDARLGRASPKVAVFGARSLSVGKDAVVRVTGTRAAAFVIADDATIAGRVSVAADCDANAPGPGGYAKDDGFGAGQNANATICGILNGVVFRCSGGSGGAGHGTFGGRGGTSANSPGGDAGKQAPAPDGGPFALVGGSGGGSPSAMLSSGAGGAGGGAIQIAAGRALSLDGVIDAAGCGGRLGAGATNGGASGGAGGMIVIEAPSLKVGGTGIAAANGGGGASGSSTGAGSAAAGANGTASATPAPGGAANGCPGGSGGALDASPGAGDNCSPGGQNRVAAGGGGAVGRILVRGALDGAPGALFSPAPTLEAAERK